MYNKRARIALMLCALFSTYICLLNNDWDAEVCDATKAEQSFYRLPNNIMTHNLTMWLLF